MPCMNIFDEELFLSMSFVNKILLCFSIDFISRNSKGLFSVTKINSFITLTL